MDKVKEILPIAPEINAVSLMPQFVSAVNVTFIESPILNTLKRVVSFVLRPLLYKAKLSSLYIKLSPALTGGFPPVPVISSLPQPINTAQVNAIAINAYIIYPNTGLCGEVFNIFLMVVVSYLLKNTAFTIHKTIANIRFKLNSYNDYINIGVA